jgi:hypothetical protein
MHDTHVLSRLMKGVSTCPTLPHSLTHPQVLHPHPAGRRPKTHGIGLEEVGVKLGQNGAIEVRGMMQYQMSTVGMND